MTATLTEQRPPSGGGLDDVAHLTTDQYHFERGEECEALCGVRRRPLPNPHAHPACEDCVRIAAALGYPVPPR